VCSSDLALNDLALDAGRLEWQGTLRVLAGLSEDLDKLAEQIPQIGSRKLRRNANAVADAIFVLVERTAKIEGLNTRLATIEGAMPVLAESGDPMLGRFEELVVALDGSIEGNNLDRLDELDLRLGELADLAEALGGAISDPDRFAGQLPAALIQKHPGGASGRDTPSIEALAQYLVLIETWQPEPVKPVILTDARETWALYGRINKVQQRLAGLGRVDPARLGARLGEIDDEVGAIDDERSRVMGLSLETLGHQQGIDDAVALLDGRMDRVEGDLDQIDSENTLAAGNTAAFVQGVRDESSISRYSSDAVDAAWRAQRDGLLAQHEIDEDAQSLREGVGALRSVFATLEGMFQGEPTIGDVPGGFDAVAMNRLVEDERVRAIERVGERVGFADVAELGRALADGSVREADAYDDWLGRIGPAMASMRGVISLTSFISSAVSLVPGAAV